MENTTEESNTHDTQGDIGTSITNDAHLSTNLTPMRAGPDVTISNECIEDPPSSEEADTFLDTPSHPTSWSLHPLRGRRMMAGYRYQRLEESQDDGDRSGKLRNSRALLVALFVVSTLLLAVMILFLAKVVFDVGGGHDCGNDDQLCLTPGCVETSADILRRMDPRVDPCQDIYHYACGGWMKSELSDQYMITTFTQVQEKVSKFIHLILEEGSNVLNGRKSSAVSKLLTLYRSCMDEASKKEIGTSKLVELINSLGSWTVVDGVSDIHLWNRTQWTLQETIENSHKLWASGLFGYTLYVDNNNVNRLMLQFNKADPTVNNSILYKMEEYKKAFIHFGTQIAVLLGGDKYVARSKMTSVFDFEKRLKEIDIPLPELTDVFQKQKKMTLKELQTLMGPWINLKQYLQKTFNGYRFLDEEEVLVLTPSYFKGLSAIVESTNKEVLANYMVWKTIRKFIPVMTEDFVNALLPLDKFEKGIEELPPKWKRCSAIVNSMGYASSAVYVDRKFNASHKATPFFKVLEVGERFRQEFISNLDGVTWLDTISKERLKDKVKAIEFNVGYPDWILNPLELDKYYDKLQIQEGEIFQNMLEIVKFRRDTQIRTYGTKADRKEWIVYPFVANAYYYAQMNSINMAAGLLQSPFLDINYPKPFLLSTIGMLWGHELTHAIESPFDKDGNLGTQLTPTAAKEHKKYAQCLVEQYGHFTLGGQHEDGMRTLAENIADNTALHLAYSIYQKDNTTHSRRLPGLNMTDNQLFFVGYAQIMCSRATPPASGILDPHSVSELRVKGVFANMPSFYEAFNCPKPSSKDMCRVW